MTEHTPESRSRELAAKATPGPYPTECLRVRIRSLGEWVEKDYDAVFLAFHDPSLITAYADVVEAVRDYMCDQHRALGAVTNSPPKCRHGKFGKAVDASLSRLDSLAKDRG